MKVEFIRDGQPQSCLMKLMTPMEKGQMVPDPRYDVLPTYYIFGGIVFSPLTSDLIKAWGDTWSKDAPADFLTLMNHQMARMCAQGLVWSKDPAAAERWRKKAEKARVSKLSLARQRHPDK